MEKKTYFDTPTQVMFLDFDNLDYDGKPTKMGGIAYRDEIICMCCGGTFSIEELYEESDEPFEILPWVGLSEEILGDLDY